MEKQDRLAVILLLLHLQLMVTSGTSLGATPTAPLRAGKLTAEVADILSERILAKLLPQEIAMLPLVASLRVSLLLGAGTGDKNCVDNAIVKRAKEIVSKTLEYWSKKSSDVRFTLEYCTAFGANSLSGTVTSLQPAKNLFHRKWSYFWIYVEIPIKLHSFMF